MPFHTSIIDNLMVYQDRLETNLLQQFAHPGNSEWFSIFSGILFEVNIVSEQKQAYVVTILCFLYVSIVPNSFSPPTCPTAAAPASLSWSLRASWKVTHYLIQTKERRAASAPSSRVFGRDHTSHMMRSRLRDKNELFRVCVMTQPGIEPSLPREARTIPQYHSGGVRSNT